MSQVYNISTGYVPPATSTNQVLTFTAESLQALETNFASLLDLQGVTVNTFVRSYSNSTTQYTNGKFMTPSTLTGTVNFNAWVSPSTGAANKNIGLNFNHLAVATGGAFDGSYTAVGTGAKAITATTGDVTLIQWSATVASLGWGVNNMIEFQLARDNTVSNNLASAMYLFLFQIIMSRT